MWNSKNLYEDMVREEAEGEHGLVKILCTTCKIKHSGLVRKALHLSGKTKDFNG